MKTIYSCSFDVDALGRSDAAASFTQALSLVRNWVEEKYAADPTKYGYGTPIKLPELAGECRPLEGHRILIQSTCVPPARICTLTWDHPGTSNSDERWSSLVQLSTDGVNVNFTLHTRFGSRIYMLRPSEYQAGTPRVVRQFLSSMVCSLNEWKLPTEVYAVDLGRIERFVTDVLLNTKRSIPVVVVSPDAWLERPTIDVGRWAHTLAGVAEVAVLANKWVAFRLTDILGKQLSCFGGAVRIYWPGFQTNSSPQKHRLWLPDTLKLRSDIDPVEKSLFGFLCAIAVTQHVESPVLSAARRVIDAAQDAQQRKVMTDVRDHLAEKSQLETWLNDAWREIGSLKARLSTAEQDAVSARNDLTEALLESEQLRENIRHIGAAAAQQQTAATQKLVEEVEPTEFSSVLEAYDAAVKRFGSRGSSLVFLDSARETAKESPYRHPEQVYAVLKELHKLAVRWRENRGELGQRWEDALAPTGFDYSPNISKTTASKFRSEYEFLYDGEMRLFAEHITKGAKNKNDCFSVHMFRDKANFRLVIGHCGNHLSNTTS